MKSSASPRTLEFRKVQQGYIVRCVCGSDGFYWLVSHSTIRARFSKDAKQCEISCPGRSQLFVQRTGSEEYVPDCTCRGNPWDAEAIARHRAYAEAANKSTHEKSGVDKAQPNTAKTKSQFGAWARAEVRD